VTSPFTDLDRPPLSAGALRRALVTDGALWAELRVTDRTASTNADVAAAARSGAPEGLVVVAEHQTSGRGRLDRTWQAPPRSGVTFSVLLRPGFPRSSWGWLPLLAGVAVVGSLHRLGGLDVTLKWPNDVQVADRKLAGILAEAVGDAVVVGVGLNVSQRADELPVPTATSLALEGCEVTDRDPVLRAVLRELAVHYRRLGEHGGDAGAASLRDAYRAACDTLGREVRVELPGGVVRTGTASDVDTEGRLVVDGTPVSAGDLVHLR
jgi:BirA family transcriptional regulator, biotin operon repressor / biotin---[acetyl-CoA-carboxylase] ligase